MAESASVPVARGGRVLVVLTIIYVFNFMDRQVLSVLAEPIKRDLGLSDTQLGLLGGFMFAIFYTTFGVPVAWLADRVSRVRVLAAACTLWSVFSVACGFAHNFTQLALARIGVGVGEAGGVPPSYSIISDTYPPHQRARALSIYSLGVPFGLAAGAMFGGWIAAKHGWRVAFYAIGAPGIVLALLLLVLVREPVRGQFDAQKPAQPPLPKAIAMFFGSPVLALTALACALGGIVNYGQMNWVSAYLIRVRGMSLTEVGSYLSLTIAISQGLGLWISGWLADKLGSKDRRAYALIPGAAMVLAIPFFLAAVTVTDWRMALPLFGIPLGLSIAYLTPSITLVQNSVPPAMRSTASALLLLLLNLVGLGFGPVYIGAVSDHFAATQGTLSLQTGFYALTPFFLLAAAGNWLAARAVVKERTSLNELAV